MNIFRRLFARDEAQVSPIPKTTIAIQRPQNQETAGGWYRNPDYPDDAGRRPARYQLGVCKSDPFAERAEWQKGLWH